MKKKKRRRPKLGLEVALVSQRNRIHTNKKKENSKKSCRNFKNK